MNYQKINTYSGWLIGLAATLVYALTMEPTVSFWDCGEFIPGALKMQVVHPPGAPLFLFVAKVFTLFAFGDLTKVAMMVNFSSALASGMAMMFLFWSITNLSKKILIKTEEDNTAGNIIAIMGAGAVGAMAACFADGIWFSAVEGEVYSMSLFFTSIVFWAILKWENAAHEKNADRWLVLIAFLMGLSTGVHLLNLLTIPALAYVYYFKRYAVNLKGIIYTFLVSCGILAFVQFGVIQQIPAIAAFFDRMFVNSFGLPFNSGVIFFLLLLVGGGVWGLLYTHKKNQVVINTAILCTLMIIIGYSSVLMVPIRSLANPPIDMNDPQDPYTLLSYLNRDQYGDRPLFKGPVFTAQPYDLEKGETRWFKNEATGKYEENGYKPIYKYQEEDQMIFPRVYDSQDPQHVRFYKSYLGLEDGEKPTFGDNLSFFFRYQVNYMYMRYFFWNFVGRQNDIQGINPNDRDGNWITGISFIDDIIVGKQDKLPTIYKTNKGRNVYFMLPLILGLLGLFYHYKKNQHDWIVVGLLFFFTGFAILLYLNQTPIQPRERDYSYAGSFYAFCIWIGIGVLYVYDFLRRKLNPTTGALIAFIGCFIAVPALMGQQNWDDHDRSTRYTARDFAINYLESCAPNAILFTQGDNDTYPLWYAQEAEGIRPDIRIINLSLLGVDWYIDQLRHKNNNADAVPLTVASEKYRGSRRDYLRLYDKKFPQNQFYKLNDLISFMFSDDPGAQLPMNNGENMNFLPAQNAIIPVDRNNVLANGTASANDSIPSEIRFKIKGSTLLKNDMFVLDIINANQWKRPIYFAVSVSPDSYQGLDNYLQLEGLTLRLTPFYHAAGQQTGHVNSGLMYNNVMNKYRWGGIDKNNVYLDENILRMANNLQNNFARLADQLVMEGKKDSAKAVLLKCLQVMPETEVPYGIYTISVADNLYKVGEKEKAAKIVNSIVKSNKEELDYYLAMPDSKRPAYSRDVQENMAVIQEMVRITQAGGDSTLNKTLNTEFNKLQPIFQQYMQSVQ